MVFYLDLLSPPLLDSKVISFLLLLWAILERGLVVLDKLDPELFSQDLARSLSAMTEEFCFWVDVLWR